VAGCDSVKDVRTEPYTPLPDEREVLKGVINGLGGGRAITLRYNDNDADALTLLGADPSVSRGAVRASRWLASDRDG
jgi:hypothetical protein